MTHNPIQSLLESIAEEHGLRRYTIKKSSGSEKGDGYFGDIAAVEITGRDDTLFLIVKSALKGEAVRTDLPVAQVYQREIYMYSTVIPSFQQFLSGKGAPPFASFAKCYRSTMVSNGEALVLENLKRRGYRLWERMVPMDEGHVAVAMKEYGRFHALSLAMRDNDPVLYGQITRSMDDMMQKFYEQSNYLNILTNECNKVAEHLDSGECPELADSFKKCIGTLPEFIWNLFKPQDYSVILHGDCWTNNLMFKYDDETKSNIPTQVCFIDLQVSRLGPPVLDTACFFYACSSKTVIDNYRHYLDLYYNSLADYLKQLGSNPDEVYPYAVFLRQWKAFAKFGLLVSIILIKLMLSEQNEVPDFSESTDTGVFDRDIARIDEYNERIRQLVSHFVNNSFI